MNIFCSALSPVTSAHNLSLSYHVDKMFVESQQIMAAIAEEYRFDAPRKADGGEYKSGLIQRNHPATKWAAESRQNFTWLLEHTAALADILDEHKDSFTEGFWEWEPVGYAVADCLPEAEVFYLYDQNGAFYPVLPDKEDVQAWNAQIAHYTLNNVLAGKYRNWMTREDKRRLMPDFSHSDNVPRKFTQLIEMYGHLVTEKSKTSSKTSSTTSFDAGSWLNRLVSVL